MQQILCEICNSPLIQSGNDNIFSCTSKLIYNKDYNKYIEDRHYTCHIDNFYKITYKRITNFPYIFQIFILDNKSTISKITLKQTFLSTIDKNQKPIYTMETKQIIELNQILSLPWNDPTIIQDKIKTYNIYS